jgi:hypothetical protein
VIATSFAAAASRRRLTGVTRHGALAIARHSLRCASCAAAGAINDPNNARMAVKRSMVGLCRARATVSPINKQHYHRPIK